MLKTMDKITFNVIHSGDSEVHTMNYEELLNLIRVIAIHPQTDEKLPDEWLVITTRHN